MSRIERSDTAGPGVGYLAETVQLCQKGHEANPVDVFTLEENDGPGKIVVRWLDPNRIQIGFANGNVVFQAVKLAGLTIETAQLDKGIDCFPQQLRPSSLAQIDTLAVIDGWWNKNAMAVSPIDRTLATYVTLVGLLVASGAVLLTTTQGGMLGLLFQYNLTGEILLALIIWGILALTARLWLVGKFPKVPLSSKAVLILGGLRLAMLIAIATIFVVWIAALILGLVAKTALFAALIDLVVVAGFSSILIGSFLNSMLVVRQRRGVGANDG